MNHFDRTPPMSPPFVWTRTPGVVSEAVAEELLAAARIDGCPRCGYRYKATRRSRRYAVALRRDIARSALALHALEVHGRSIDAIRAEESARG